MARILLVDDDTLVLASVQMLLVLHGFDVVAADEGSKAVCALVHDSFDVVIVDLFMPGMDGYETIKEFQKIVPGVPIIAMSGAMSRESPGRLESDFLETAGKMGASRMLHKPFKPEQLIDAVHGCLDTGAQRTEMRKNHRR
jgi:DNA-binding NtrC family response regulator